eukprot:g70206.t1
MGRSSKVGQTTPLGAPDFGNLMAADTMTLKGNWRDIRLRAEDQGWTVACTKGGHLLWKSPDGPIIVWVSFGLPVLNRNEPRDCLFVLQVVQIILKYADYQGLLRTHNISSTILYSSRLELRLQSFCTASFGLVVEKL